jgi:ribosomal-protein-alanine N-acetyltransferase
MSAVQRTGEAQFEPMAGGHLQEVLRIERAAYSHPWGEVNFLDAIGAGYQAQMLVADGTLLGYFIAMKGVDEVHLLNITVAPGFQGQGWARLMLQALTVWARAQGSQWVWLEVRVGNARAIQVYQSEGFRRVGHRKAYYPADNGGREDAIVMSLKL